MLFVCVCNASVKLLIILWTILGDIGVPKDGAGRGCVPVGPRGDFLQNGCSAHASSSYASPASPTKRRASRKRCREQSVRCSAIHATQAMSRRSPPAAPRSRIPARRPPDPLPGSALGPAGGPQLEPERQEALLHYAGFLQTFKGCAGRATGGRAQGERAEGGGG